MATVIPRIAVLAVFAFTVQPARAQFPTYGDSGFEYPWASLTGTQYETLQWGAVDFASQGGLANGCCFTADGNKAYTGYLVYPYVQLAECTRSNGPGSQFSAPTFVASLFQQAPNFSRLLPAVRGDDLELFFCELAGNPGAPTIARIMSVTRPSTTSTWSVPALVYDFLLPGAVLVTWYNQPGISLSVSEDGLELCFTGFGDPINYPHRIWTMTRPTTTAAWNSPTLLSYPIWGTSEVESAKLGSNGLRLVYSLGDGLGYASWSYFMCEATRVDRNAPFTLTSVSLVNPYNSSHGKLAALLPGGEGALVVAGAALPILRYHGLVQSRAPATGTATSLWYRDAQGSAGLPYIGALSFSSTPGVSVGARVLPFTFDDLFSLTLGGLPGVLSGFSGSLDPTGAATAQIIPLPVAVIGFTFVAVFCTLDPGAPYGLGRNSSAVPLTVQP